jgi:hypothetical protein
VLIRASLVAALSMLPTLPAAAQDGCGQFSSVGRRVDLFAEYLPTVASTQSLPKEGTFALALTSASEVIYLVAPERGSDTGYGGIVTVESIPAGRYQIALSDEAWMDAVQGGTRLALQPVEPTGDCPGVHRRVQVIVDSLPLTLQIGGARKPRIYIAVMRLWPAEWKW